MRLAIIILTIFSIKNSHQRVEFIQQELVSSVLLRFVNATLCPYYEKTRNLFVFASNPEMLGGISPPVPCLLFKDWDALTKIMSEMIYTLIVFLDGRAADGGFDDAERLQGFRTKQPILIVCEGAAACGSKVYLEKIAPVTNSPLLHYVFADEGGSVRIFRRTTTAEGSCGVPRLVRIAYDESKTWPNDETFFMPPNFNKCPVRLATTLSPDKSRPCESGDANSFCGMEGEVVKLLVDKINATPVTTVMIKREEVVDFVATRQADLGYGHLFDENNRTFAHSAWYMFIKAAFLIPHSASVPSGSLLSMTSPLDHEVWIALAVAIAGILLLGKIIPNFRRIDTLQQFGLIIGHAAPIRLRENSQRIYFFSIVLFGFLISQSYLVNLAKIYLTSAKNYIQTPEELEASGLRVYGSPNGKNLLNKFGYTRIAENYELVDATECLTRFREIAEGRSSDPLYVELSPDVRATLKNAEDMTNVVEWFSLTILTPNSSTIRITMNKLLVMMTEHKVLKSFSIVEMLGNYTPILEKEKAGEPRKLELNMMQGVFLLHSACLTLCTFVFIVELAFSFIKNNSAASNSGNAY